LNAIRVGIEVTCAAEESACSSSVLIDAKTRSGLVVEASS